MVAKSSTFHKSIMYVFLPTMNPCKPSPAKNPPPSREEAMVQTRYASMNWNPFHSVVRTFARIFSSTSIAKTPTKVQFRLSSSGGDSRWYVS